MTNGQHSLADSFVDLAIALDHRLRKLDWRWFRSFDSPLSRIFYGVDGYSPVVLFVLIIALAFQIFGPSLGTRGGAIAYTMLLGALPLQWLLARLARLGVLRGLVSNLFGGDALLFAQSVTVFTVSAAVFFVLASAEARLADGEFYRHILAPTVWVLLAALLLAQFLARRMFRRYRGRFAAYLQETELFVKPERPTAVTLGSIAWSFLTAPVRHPLYLALFPSFVVLVANDPQTRTLWGLVLLAASWAALGLAGIHERLQFLIAVPRRVFFVGGQLAVSLLIIVLAYLRLTEDGYVSMLLDSTAGPVVAAFVFAAYFTFWFYEYWINRLLCVELLRTMSAAEPVALGRVSYPINPGVTPVAIRVEMEGREIHIHGSERFVAVGRHRDNAKNPEVFQFYTKGELFARIFDSAAARGVLSPEASEAQRHELERRMQYYFLALNAVLAAALVVSIYVLHMLPQVPELCVAALDRVTTGCVAATAPDRDRVDLADLIAKSDRKNVVLVAASGGGTRAALYTASVLRGLDRLGALQDVVLVSGVSGGSAALAYFAAHRGRLINGAEDEWRKYLETMSAAFILDVMRGVPEWRIAQGARLGTVLAESFERRMQPPKTAARLGDVRELGVIFNTTLAGHLHRAGPGDESLSEWETHARRLTRSDTAGGRLILTNLASRGYFPNDGRIGIPPAHFKYIVVNEPQVPLTAAAALSANFPPVFSNAAVDVYEQDRYWVTDGGAADNRGLVELLYALRQSLAQLDKAKALPAIHVVVAEASKENFDYRQDRGLGAKSGSTEKYASQLSEELWQDIVVQYQRLGGKSEDLHMHYLTMPLTLRTRGGLGTHWILPNTVKLRDGVVADPEKSDPASVTLTGAEVRDLIYELHDVAQDRCSRIPVIQDANLQSVWRWVCKDTLHANAWKTLKAAFAH